MSGERRTSRRTPATKRAWTRPRIDTGQLFETQSAGCNKNPNKDPQPPCLGYQGGKPANT